MSQRTALILAAGLTTCVLILLGGIVLLTTQPDAPAVTSASDTATMELQGQNAPQAQSASARNALSPELASTIALNGAAGATLTRPPELVNFQGTIAYEVVLDRGLVYVDANTGQVIYDGTAAPSNARGEHEEREHEDDHHEE
jgi:hypothetical protein